MSIAASRLAMAWAPLSSATARPAGARRSRRCRRRRRRHAKRCRGRLRRCRHRVYRAHRRPAWIKARFRSEPAPKFSVACVFRFRGLAVAVFCFSVAPLGIKLAHDSSFLASIAHRLMRRRHAGGKRKPRRSGRTRLRFVDEDGGAFDYLGVILKPPDRLSCTPATGFPSLDLVRFQQDELVDLHLAHDVGANRNRPRQRRQAGSAPW
jgi:hypothetical protein